MSRENATTKAQRLLLSGAVIIREVNPVAVVIRADVRGDSGTYYQVAFTATDGWTCSCPAYTWRCSHTRAVEWVRPAERATDRRHLHSVPQGVAQ